MLIALAQFRPDPEPVVNAELLDGLAGRAAADGARLLLAPEGCSTDFLDDSAATVRTAAGIDGPFGAALLKASGEHGIAIAAGTFTNDAEGGRVHNTVLIADKGTLLGRYRKIHLYDAFSFTESRTVAPGPETPPVIELDGVVIGFATCYDLRFPELFRVLRAAGADVLALSSAWVVGPGKEEHWLTLLRARAIENTCYMVAADQVGPKGIGRSAAFDPFGLPLIDLGTASPGYGLVEIRPERIAEIREMLPCGEHTRFVIDPVPSGRPITAR